MKNLQPILIIDDDDREREAVSRTLQNSGYGYECCEASNIHQALGFSQQREFNCAIIGHHLLVQDGLLGISEIQRLWPHIGIVMLIDKGSELLAADAMKLGALDYMYKSHVTDKSMHFVISDVLKKVERHRKIANQNEVLKEFTQTLVHDLRDPLAAIQGCANFIDQAITEQNLSEIKKNHTRITRMVSKLNAIISALHHSAQADTHMMFEWVSLEDVLEDVLANLSEIIATRGAEITYDQLPAVWGSHPLLMLLFQNLIANSIKYCEVKPIIKIKQLTCDGDNILISITDNGIGIAAQYHETIFQSFKRLHSQAQYDGVGLGLSTCKRIVESHGGSIWCESAEGKGATFFLKLRRGLNASELS